MINFCVGAVMRARIPRAFLRGLGSHDNPHIRWRDLLACSVDSDFGVKYHVEALLSPLHTSDFTSADLVGFIHGPRICRRLRQRRASRTAGV